MFKSVLTIIFVIIVLIIARTVTQRLKKLPPKEPISHNDTVQCVLCKTYVPREDAVFKGDNAFCSAQHLNDWNSSS